MLIHTVPVIANAVTDATLALAVVTGVLASATVAVAVISVRGIRSARKDVTRQIDAMRTATGEQLTAARDELDASHRPLLIEVFPDGPIYADMGARDNPNISRAPGRDVEKTIPVRFDGTNPREADPRLVFVEFERSTFFISAPLRNVGRGLAVIVESEITVDGDAVYGLKAPPSATRVRVPDRETTRVNIVAQHHSGVAIGPGDRWTLTVPYTDFAGRQRTIARLVLEHDGGSSPHQWRAVDVKHVGDPGS
ncbi:MAG: hypothetical protein ACYCU0_01255 [Solirubrobacteraceae bacterium]